MTPIRALFVGVSWLEVAQRKLFRRVMAHAAFLLVLSLTEWVDVDSPLSAHSSTFQFDGSAVRLVFSDEFERDGRTFHDGEEARWAAVSLPPATNEQVNWYNTSLADTKDGKLELWAINQDVTFPVNQSFETRHVQTPMLQTWNKFCFTGGAVDVRAKMPGLPYQEGLWPAFWLMGNLGRATFSYSTDGLWPFIFDVCVPHDSPDCFANQCTAQKISACNPGPGFGMNPFQVPLTLPATPYIQHTTPPLVHHPQPQPLCHSLPTNHRRPLPAGAGSARDRCHRGAARESCAELRWTAGLR